MRGQDDHHVLANLRQQVQEAVALFRVQAGGGLVDNDQLRVAKQCLGDAETLAHATREAGEGFFAHVPEVHLLQQRFHGGLAFAADGQPFQYGQMVQHVVGANPRVHAEVLWQVAEPGAQFAGGGQDIQATEADSAGSGNLQRGDTAHQRGFARAVRPQQPEHTPGDFQRDPIQSAGAVGVDVGELFDVQHGEKSFRTGPGHRSTPTKASRCGTQPILGIGVVVKYNTSR